MPVHWSANKDRRLLLLVLELTKIDKKAVADLWAKKYSHENEDQPTPRAISERLVKLIKTVDGGVASGTPSPRKSPVKPKTPRGKSVRTPTPTSRKRARRMSDEGIDDLDDGDDDEEDSLIKEEDITPRAKLPRQSKALSAGAKKVQREDSAVQPDAKDANDASTLQPATPTSVEDSMSDGSEYTME